MVKKPVIILRAEDDAPPMLERLTMLGFNAVSNPLLRHVRAPDAQAQIDAAGEHDALIITSGHALDGITLPEHLAKLPCYCVGQRTAATLLSRGISECEIFATSEKLNARLAQDNVSKPLYLRGEHIKQAFEGVKEIVTYSAEATMELGEGTREILNGDTDYALAFTSGRIVHLWSLLLEQEGLEETKKHAIAFCMSEVIASQASVYGFVRNHTSAHPDLDSLYSCIEAHY